MESIRRAEAQRLLGVAEVIDPAYAALYLSSDEARVTTGHVLVVDSSYTMS